MVNNIERLCELVNRSREAAQAVNDYAEEMIRENPALLINQELTKDVQKSEP